MTDSGGDDKAIASAHLVLSEFDSSETSELVDLVAMREVAAGSGPFDRATPLHLTASSLIVDPSTRRVLLRWHGRLHCWMQVGGHGDPGELAPYVVALREATEESGLEDLRPFPDETPTVVQVVVVEVPASNNEAPHRHGDIRYLMATAHPEQIRPESLDTPLRWCGIDEARALVVEENLLQLLDRTESLLALHT